MSFVPIKQSIFIDNMVSSITKLVQELIVLQKYEPESILWTKTTKLLVKIAKLRIQQEHWDYIYNSIDSSSWEIVHLIRYGDILELNKYSCDILISFFNNIVITAHYLVSSELTMLCLFEKWHYIGPIIDRTPDCIHAGAVSIMIQNISNSKVTNKWFLVKFMFLTQYVSDLILYKSYTISLAALMIFEKAILSQYLQTSDISQLQYDLADRMQFYKKKLNLNKIAKELKQWQFILEEKGVIFAKQFLSLFYKDPMNDECNRGENWF
eukprot:115366_1